MKTSKEQNEFFTGNIKSIIKIKLLVPIRDINQSINKSSISLRKKHINEIYSKKRIHINFNKIQDNNKQFLYNIENLQIADEIKKQYFEIYNNSTV